MARIIRYIASNDGVHAPWGKTEHIRPSVVIETGTSDSEFMFVEARNSEGYTFVPINRMTALELGLRLIREAGIDNLTVTYPGSVESDERGTMPRSSSPFTYHPDK